jgi:hypothetical protein
MHPPSRRWLLQTLIALAVTAVGCNDKSLCGDDEDCPGFDVDAGALDAKVSWGTENTLDVALNGPAMPQRVVGGEAVFTPTDPDCSVDCEYQLKSFYFELESMLLAPDEGSAPAIDIDALRIGLGPDSSVSLPDASGAYVIPAKSKIQGCAEVDGERLTTESELETEATLVIDPITEEFSFSGRLPFEFRAMPNRSCVDYELSISGSATAHVPWEQTPRAD